MTEILRGYRVLDFGRYISGPFCAALLGDMGADVIRIEPPQGGDDRYVMALGEGGDGALHHQVNRGKRSLTLDLSAPASRVVVERLVADADVVIANLPPKALAKLGLDYPTLALLKPDIVLTTINAYGSEGPFVDAVGFDGSGQALSGALSLTGMPDQPYRSAVSFVDYATAISAAMGTLAALLQREKTGRGEHVQCSLLGTALTMTNPMLIEEAAGARSRVASGNRSPIAGPSDLFRTRDGWVMIQVIGQAMFRRWAILVDRSDLLDDQQFVDDQARGENGAALSAITANWAAGKTSAECLAELREHRLPASPMLRPRDVLDASEVAQGGLFDTVAPPGLPAIPLVASPVRFGAAERAAPRPAPALGRDTRDILHEFGFDDAEIAMLAKAKAIAVARPQGVSSTQKAS